MSENYKPRILVIEGRPMVTSVAVAEQFGIRHDNVLRDIENALREVAEDFGLLNFAPSSYVNLQGKSQPMYRLTREGWDYLAMGYTTDRAMRWKEAYVAAFQQMTGKLFQPAGRMAARLRKGVARCLEAAEALQARHQVLRKVLTHGAWLQRELARKAELASGANDLALALCLADLRVPDAQIYLHLLEASNPSSAGGVAQWVRVSYAGLAGAVGDCSPARACAALDRLYARDLLERRVVAGGRADIEYRADLQRAEAVLERRWADPAHRPMLQWLVNPQPQSPVRRLTQRGTVELLMTTSESIEQTLAAWAAQVEQFAAESQDSALRGVLEELRALSQPGTHGVAWEESSDGVGDADDESSALAPVAANPPVGSSDEPHIILIRGEPTTTSLAMATHFERQHKDVLRAIKNVRARLSREFCGEHFEDAGYVNQQGKIQPMVRLTRAGFSMAVMSFRGEGAAYWRVAYLKAFARMEVTLAEQCAQQLKDLGLLSEQGAVLAAQVGDAERTLAQTLRQVRETLAAVAPWANSPSGADQLGQALVLTGMRLPDALLYLHLAGRCNPTGVPGGQWVRASCRTLAQQLAWTTPGRVRGAVGRMVALGLVASRTSALRRRALEYRVDPSMAPGVLDRALVSASATSARHRVNGQARPTALLALARAVGAQGREAALAQAESAAAAWQHQANQLVHAERAVEQARCDLAGRLPAGPGQLAHPDTQPLAGPASVSVVLQSAPALLCPVRRRVASPAGSGAVHGG